jgi:hypothetical protein
MRPLIAAALMVTGSVFVGLAGSGIAHATPNTDRTEEVLTCSVLDKWTTSPSTSSGGIGQAVQMALMGIQVDTGMGVSDAGKFLRKSVDDYCPQYNGPIDAWTAHR